jgi:hypothetical protein
MATNDSQLVCCPEFNPEPWNDKILIWENKRFIKEKVCTLFYMPVNFGRVMKRLDRKVTAAEAQIPDWLCLSDHTSKWNMDIYLAVDKDIPNSENVVINGKFYSRVYEGPFKETGNWCKDFESVAQTKGFQVKKWYMWYTTCPKCAKKYGKNYVVVVGQIE